MRSPNQYTMQLVRVTDAKPARLTGCRDEIALRGPILQPKPSDSCYPPASSY